MCPYYVAFRHMSPQASETTDDRLTLTEAHRISFYCSYGYQEPWLYEGRLKLRVGCRPLLAVPPRFGTTSPIFPFSKLNIESAFYKYVGKFAHAETVFHVTEYCCNCLEIDFRNFRQSLSPIYCKLNANKFYALATGTPYETCVT